MIGYDNINHAKPNRGHTCSKILKGIREHSLMPKPMSHISNTRRKEIKPLVNSLTLDIVLLLIDY